MEIIALGHDQKIFDTTSRVFARQIAYAERVTKLTIIIPTKYPIAPIKQGNLMVEAAVARLPLVRFWRLLAVTSHHARQLSPDTTGLLTVQSPFEFGVIGLIVRWRTKLPLEVQVHGDFYSSSYWRSESFLNRIRGVIGLYVLRRADRVRVVSERIKRSLVSKGVAAERIVVLPINSDIAQFYTATPTPLWSADGSLTIISVGRFSREKNLPLLIRAFHTVHAEFPQTRLVLVGEGGEASHLRTLIATLWPKNSPVSLHPWQHSIASVMRAADIYVLSSDYEGYAMVLPEAMAAGLAIVTTDVGCVGEYCMSDTHALVVPPRDEKAFTRALHTIVADQSKRATMRATNQAVVSPTTEITYTDQVVSGWQQLSN